MYTNHFTHEQFLKMEQYAVQSWNESFEKFKYLRQWGDKTFYTQKEVLKLLDISPNTLKKYRDNGYIAYSRVDDKYFYTKKDIDEFLTNTHCPAWQFH